MKRKKNEEHEQSQITTIYILGFIFYFAWKQNLKKVVYTINFYLQYLCIAGYLKRINDIPNLNIHKYTNENIKEIYINTLNTTTKIFMAMDYFTIMLRSTFILEKDKNIWQGHFSPTP